MGVIDLLCMVGGQDMQIRMHVVLRRSSLFAAQELLLTKRTNHRPYVGGYQVDILNLTCVTREGFWRGSDRNPDG